MWRRRLKIPFAASTGGLVTLVLFGLMHLLISGGSAVRGQGDTLPSIRFGPVELEPPPPPKVRTRPEQPEPPKALPRPTPLEPTPVEAPSSLPLPNTPDIDLTLGPGGPFTRSLCGGPLASCAKALGDGDIVALARIQPTYPRRAALRGIEGFVIVEFTITDSGTVINPRVVEAQPRRMFEQAALRSIVRWRFKPKVIDGNAISRQATQRLEFRLDSGAAGL